MRSKQDKTLRIAFLEQPGNKRSLCEKIMKNESFFIDVDEVLSRGVNLSIGTQQRKNGKFKGVVVGEKDGNFFLLCSTKRCYADKDSAFREIKSSFCQFNPEAEFVSRKDWSPISKK